MALPWCGREYNEEEQQATEARVEESILAEKDIDVNSEEAMAQLQRMKSSVRNMVVRSMDPGRRAETDEMLGEFSDAGDEFARRAHSFDPDLQVEDLFQALRNLWILNSMQAGFGLPVRVTPSGVAYSLLYPYSDNFLDDPVVTGEEKREFSKRFRLRLSGYSVPAPSRLEAKISDLVEMIESEFPRSSFPDVFESLLAIHAGQEKSLRQHSSSKRWTESDLMDISIEKGGTSVLADAYLAKGYLSLENAAFSFGYGVFLQLIDDLQDVEEDLRNGHQTLFTLAASMGTLDAAANRLHAFTDVVLTLGSPRVFRNADTLTELVRRSCRFLILESIARCPRLFSETYSRNMERYSPMRFSRIRWVHEKMKANQVRVRKALKNKRVFTVIAACV